MRLTIITATRNSAATVNRAMESAARCQPGDQCDIEHVIIDGGSDDGTVQLIHAKHPTARIETQAGRGLYQALNEGINKAGGDYIMFLHSDDEIGKVDLREIDLRPDTVVYGTVEFIDADNKLLFRRRAPLFPKACLSQYPFIFHPNAIYPRWLLLKYPFDGEKHGMVADMWQINAFRNVVRFAPTKAITYRFRIHKHSSTVKNLNRKFPLSFWMWRLYLFLFFEDCRTMRIWNLLHGKRTWG